MTTPSDYALLANAAYADTRSRTDNAPVLPTNDWLPLDRTQFGLTDDPDPSSGFSAEIFKNRLTGEVVIAFEGTNPEALGADGLRDWVTNILTALSWATKQVKQGAVLYEKVKAAFPDNTPITFTGHSLGGGLAGLMSIYFNRPATVFDPAPFRLAANPSNAQALQALLAASGFSDDELNSLAGSGVGFDTLAERRLSGVQGQFLSGEIVAVTRSQSKTAATWPLTEVEVGQQELSPFSLHSMQILAAVLGSTAFKGAASALPELLKLLDDTKMYAQPLAKDVKDVLQRLLEFQFGAPGVTANGMLDAFGSDSQQIGRSGALENPKIREGAIAATIEFYNFVQNNSLDFIKDQSGGVSFDLSAIDLLPGQASRAAPRLKAALESLIPKRVGGTSNGFSAGTAAPVGDYQQWFIQGGTGGMTASAVDGASAALIGGMQSDTLTGASGGDFLFGGGAADQLGGGAGNDLVFGEEGDDRIEGGTGDDYLEGGSGRDAFIYSTGDGKDRIRDLDGLGAIQIGTLTLGEAKKSTGIHEWALTGPDGHDITLTFLAGDSEFRGTLTIQGDSLGGAGNQIQILDFEDRNTGFLGITLSSDKRTELRAGIGGNPWIEDGSHAARTGQVASVGEGGAQTFTVALSESSDVAQHVKLSLGALADKFQAVLGEETVPFTNGEVELVVAPGQNQVSFSLVELGDIDASAVDTLTATVLNADGSVAATNAVSLDIRAMEEATVPPVTTRDIQGGFADGTDDLGNHFAGTFDPNRNDILFDSAGNDHIMAGGGNDQVLAGRGGDDWIEAGDGGDAVDAGSGNDLVVGQAGADILFGSTGDDRVFAEDAVEEQAAITAGASAADGGAGGDFLNGNEGDDLLVGNDQQNILEGGAGDDRIVAGGGADLIEADGDVRGLVLGDSLTLTPASPHDPDGSLAGTVTVSGAGTRVAVDAPGNDVVHAGGGDDFVLAGAGDDMLWGEEGSDTLFGDAGGDTLLGGAGNDFLSGDNGGSVLDYASHGEDFLDGGAGDDNLLGDAGSDALYGGEGDDILIGDSSPINAGDDYLSGEAGNDQVQGGMGEDTVLGGEGNDILVGDNGGTDLSGDADFLDGGAGNDTLVGNGGDDVLLGGDGIDSMSGDDGDDTLEGGAGEDTLLGVAGEDTLLGGDGNDHLTGGLGEDTLSGGDGNDEISGDEGGASDAPEGDGDFIDGGAGDDTIIGQGGDDVIMAGDGADQVDGGVGDDIIDGGADDDTLQGGTGEDSLDGAEGNDTILGGQGQDDISGGAGNDGLVGDDGVTDNLGDADFIDGGAGDDQIFGQAGDDMLQGGEGGDQLQGNEGNDTLEGGAGDDVLDGGAGDDTLAGGDGADTYAYDFLNGGVDHLQDTGANTLVLHGIQPAFLQLNLGSMVLSAGDPANVIHLDNFDPDNVAAGAGVDTFVFDDGTVLSYEQLVSRGFVVGGTPDADFLEGTSGSDAIDALESDDTVIAKAGNDRVDAGTGDDIVDAGEGDDTVLAGDGNDIVYGGKGNDELNGDFGDDQLYGEKGVDTLSGGDGNDLLDGGIDGDTLEGGAGDDTLLGGKGSDTLLGEDGAGIDVLQGGTGNDTYFIDTADTIVENADEGTDTVNVTFDYALGDNLENLTLAAGAGAIDGTGNALDNRITGNESDNQLFGLEGDDVLAGNDGNDFLDGGAGADLFLGGLGDDTYVLDDTGDVIREAPDVHTLTVDLGTGEEIRTDIFGGVDSVIASNHYALDYDLENLTLVGSARVGRGNIESNVIVGNDAGDLLTAYTLNRASDNRPGVLVGFLEPGDGAQERLNDRAAQALYKGELTTQDFNSIGTVIDLGPREGDALIGGAGDDTLLGDLDDDYLEGGEGNDLLFGFGGADTLVGGAGDDTYVVDEGYSYFEGFSNGPSLSYEDGSSDGLIENAGEGTDTVLSRIDHTLGDNFENLTLIADTSAYEQDLGVYGHAAPNGDFHFATFGQGNALDNIITGNDFGDELYGEEGNDALIGGAAPDFLDGGAGDDSMAGGAGDDVYEVDSLADQVTEASGLGTDLVETWLEDYALGENVENLNLLSDADSVGTGNELDNVITGGSGNDTLLGLAGNDTLDGGFGDDQAAGGTGDDTYFVDSEFDSVLEAPDEGYDSVFSAVSYQLGDNVEALYLTGSNGDFGAGNDLDNLIVGDDSWNELDGAGGDDVMEGGEGNDALYGEEGNDLLDGGFGDDYMEGGAGDDTYRVDSFSDQVVESFDEGTDTVEEDLSFYTLGANVENATVTGSFGTDGGFPYSAWSVQGNELDNRILGNDAQNFVDGGDGNDTVDGFAFDDTLQGDAGNDVLYGGDDVVMRGSDIDPGGESGIDPLAQVIAPNADALYGGAGDDDLDGGSGNDGLFGDDGDDVLYGGDDGAEVALETFFNGEGGVEFSGVNGVLFIGDGFFIDHSHGSLTNDDFLYGGAGDDVLDGGSGNDQLFAGDGNDELYGGEDGPLNKSNDDYLDGGAGIDFMAGGTGDDIYVVDGVFTETTDIPVYDLCGDVIPGEVTRLWTTDTVFERAGEGYDVVRASTDVTLTDNVEELDLEWFSAAVLGRGNAGDNLISGNGNDNRLEGGAGDDRLFGDAGNDVLEGGDGNDFLQGGAGDDTYLFGASSGRDLVSSFGGGFDAVHVEAAFDPSDVVLSRNGDDVTIAAPGTGARMTLSNWFAQPGVQEIDFCNGTSWDAQAIADLANARRVDAQDDSGFVQEDGATVSSGNVLDDDSGSAGALTVTNPGSYTGQYGTLSLSADGSYSYALDNSAVQWLAQGETLSDSFVYDMQDEAGAGDSASLGFDIFGTNDDPVVAAAPGGDGATLAEDALVLQPDGALRFTDVDLADAHQVFVDQQGFDYVGFFDARLVADSTGGFTGRVDWTFSADNADIQYLAEGEVLEQDYDVSVDDGFGAGTQTVSIRLVGTNDAPSIDSADDASEFIEDDGTPADGTLDFSDVDLADVHTVAVTPAQSGYLGGLQAAVTLDSTQAGAGSVDWAFTADSAALDFLAEGEVLLQDYDITVDDGHAGGTATQSVEITIVGTNDDPVLQAGEGAVTEDATLSEIVAGANLLANGGFETGDFAGWTLAGNVDFTDVDDVTPASGGFAANFGAIGAEGSLTQAVATSDGQQYVLDFRLRGGGTEGADFTVSWNGEMLDTLADQVLDDYTGFEFLLSGTDGSSSLAFAFRNDPELWQLDDVSLRSLQPQDVLPAEQAASGTLTFSDVDLADAHEVFLDPQDTGYLGSVDVEIAQDSTGSGTGTLAWSFSVDNAALQYLAEGETLTQSYDVTLDDGNAVATQTLTVTLAGVDDAPVVTAADVAGTVVEDVSSGGLESTGGGIDFSDVDLTDAHAATAHALGTGYLGAFDAQIIDDSTGGTTGTIDWAFSIDDGAIQYLAEGETLVQTYVVGIDDGHAGGMATQLVDIGIVGTNDAPVAFEDAASVSEDGPLAASGNVLANDTDPDHGTVLAVASPGTYAGDYGALVLQGDGSYTYTLDDATVQSLGAGQSFTDSFTYAATDGALASGSLLTVTIAGANDAPVLANPIPDQSANAGSPFSFTFAANTFTDIDEGDVLSYSATLADGAALPSWLSFDAVARTFAGTPPEHCEDDALALRVAASDPAGASAFGDFALAIGRSAGGGQLIAGTPGDDVLTGTVCDDVIDGREGFDKMSGGQGDDTYFVDKTCRDEDDEDHEHGNEGVGNGEDPPPPGHDANYNDGPGTGPGNPGSSHGNGVSHDDRGGSGSGDHGEHDDDSDEHECLVDEVIENPDEGYDTVYAAADYTLPDNVEEVHLLGGGDFDATGNGLANVLEGSAGDNTLSAGAGADTYVYSLGGGKDTIDEKGASGEADTLKLQGVAADAVRLAKSGNNLVVDFPGHEGRVTIKDWFASSASRVERFQFDDGTVWDEAKIRAQVGKKVAPVGGGSSSSSQDAHHGNDRDERRSSQEARDEDGHSRDRDEEKCRTGAGEAILRRLRTPVSFSFEQIAQALGQPEPTLSAAQIARRWASVRDYFSDAGGWQDPHGGDALPSLKDLGLGLAAQGGGFGFEGSIGEHGRSGNMKGFKGLSEGFRRL